MLCTFSVIQTLRVYAISGRKTMHAIIVAAILMYPFIITIVSVTSPRLLPVMYMTLCIAYFCHTSISRSTSSEPGLPDAYDDSKAYRQHVCSACFAVIMNFD